MSNTRGGWEIFLCLVNCVMNSMVGWNVGQPADVTVYPHSLYSILSSNEAPTLKGHKFDLALPAMQEKGLHTDQTDRNAY